MFDTVSQFNVPGCKRDLRGFTIFHQPGALRKFVREHLRKPLRALYQPKGGSRDEHFDAVTAIVLGCKEVTYVVDEVDAFCDPNWMRPNLNEVAHYGRHYRVALLWIARRPQDIARGLSSQTKEFRCFQTDEEIDLQKIGKRIGESNAQALRSLPPYHYLRWRDDKSPVVTLRNDQK